MILTFSTAREWEEKNHPSVHANILSAKGPCWLMATAFTSKRAISIIGFWIRWRPLALNSSLRTKMSNYPFYSTLPFVCSHKLASFLPDIREKKIIFLHTEPLCEFYPWLLIYQREIDFLKKTLLLLHTKGQSPRSLQPEPFPNLISVGVYTFLPAVTLDECWHSWRSLISPTTLV